MHVLQINNNHRIIGGSDSVYFNTGALLERDGHQVSYFAARGDNDEPSADSAYFPDALDTRHAGMADALRFLRNGQTSQCLERLLREKEHVDLAHLHIYHGRLTPTVLGPLRKGGIPILQTLHEYKLACPVYTHERHGHVCEACLTGSTMNCLRYRCKDGSLGKSAMLWLDYHLSRLQGAVDHIDRFICVSDFQRSLMVRAGVPEQKLVTLHNFVDPGALRPQTEHPREDYLLYFGRIEKLKGVPTLIEAVKNTGHQLKIAGDGAWRSELEATIAGRSHIEYLGYTSGEALRSLVARAKAVVVPSEWYENCSMTVLEAKAVGTPIIATRIGGLSEVVRDGIDGILHKVGDANALAEALSELDKRDLAEMGQAAQSDIQARFSPGAHLRRLLEIYADTMHARSV